MPLTGDIDTYKKVLKLARAGDFDAGFELVKGDLIAPYTFLRLELTDPIRYPVREIWLRGLREVHSVRGYVPNEFLNGVCELGCTEAIALALDLVDSGCERHFEQEVTVAWDRKDNPRKWSPELRMTFVKLLVMRPVWSYPHKALMGIIYTREGHIARRLLKQKWRRGFGDIPTYK